MHIFLGTLLAIEALITTLAGEFNHGVTHMVLAYFLLTYKEKT